MAAARVKLNTRSGSTLGNEGHHKKTSAVSTAGVFLFLSAVASYFHYLNKLPLLPGDDAP